MSQLESAPGVAETQQATALSPQLMTYKLCKASTSKVGDCLAGGRCMGEAGCLRVRCVGEAGCLHVRGRRVYG